MKDSLKLIELQCAVIAHCTALRHVIALWQDGKIDAAIARLEGAVTALDATSRGQVAGVSMKCDVCGESSALVDWAVEGVCPKCNAGADDESEAP